MFALVDCNNFFCSVEKVFHPGLSGKPVCVLSSNDGCVVALTPEAKALGLHRGDPVFKVKDIVEKNNVKIFSGNISSPLNSTFSSRHIPSRSPLTKALSHADKDNNIMKKNAKIGRAHV